MVWLIAGVALWAVVHWMPVFARGLRAALQRALGEQGHKLLVTALLIGAIILIVIGWKATEPVPVYDPPLWARHLTMTLMLLAIYLLGAAYGTGRVRQRLRHPMLTGVVIWSAAHLLSNGDMRSLILFGGIGLWAMLSIPLISARDGAWQKPTRVAPWGRELVSVIITLVLYGALFMGHRWFTGMPLIGG